jgi:hypothetical protein
MKPPGSPATVPRSKGTSVGSTLVGGCLTTTLLFLIRSLVRSHTISRPQASSQAPAHRRWSRADCHPAGAAPPAVAYPTCGCRLVRRTGRCRRASRCNSACRRPYCRRGREQHHARFAPRGIAARDPDRRQVCGRACVHCHRSAIASLAFLMIPEGVRTIPAT